MIVTHSCRRAERAARLTGAAQALISVIGAEQMNWSHLADTRIAGLRAQLGDARYAAAWATGRAMTLEQAIAYALDALGDGAGLAAPGLGHAEQHGGGSGERPVTRLTRREVEVLTVVAEGATGQEVATRLGVRPRTVTTYLTSIYAKLAVCTRTAAVRVAREHDLIFDDPFDGCGPR